MRGEDEAAGGLVDDEAVFSFSNSSRSRLSSLLASSAGFEDDVGVLLDIDLQYASINTRISFTVSWSRLFLSLSSRTSRFNGSLLLVGVDEFGAPGALVLASSSSLNHK